MKILSIFSKILLLLIMITNFAYSQKLNATFDTGIPEGWQVIDGDNDGNIIKWQNTETLDDRVNYAGGQKLANDFLISPKVKVTNSDKTLSFNFMTQDYSNDYYELKIYAVENIPTNDNYSSESPIFNDYLGDYEWTQKTLDLTGFVGKNVYIVFNITNDWANTVNSFCGIDDITGPELCIEAKPNIQLEANSFSSVLANNSSTAMVTVTNTGNADLKVTNVAIDAPFSVKETDKNFVLTSGSNKQIEVTFAPTEANTYTKPLTFTINGNYTGENSINLNAICLAGKPSIDLSINEFDRTIAGQQNTSSLTVTNTGNADLKVTNIVVNVPFSIKDADKSFVLTSGKNKQIEVTFAPNQSGVYTKTITFTINGNYEGTNTIEAKAYSYIPDLLFEDFELEQFPPLSWTLKNHGSEYYTWDRTTTKSSIYEGKGSAYAGKDGGILSTPKLKIATGDKLEFYAFHSASSQGPLTIKYSTDNSTWNDLQSVNLTDNYTKIEVDLSSITGEYFIGFDAKKYVYIDNIKGPEMLLASLPTASKNPIPRHKDEGQNNILELSWDKVLGADGYKITLGTEINPTEIYNSKDLGNVSKINVYGLKFGTKYKWKIVPYNNGIDAVNCDIWEFTTMADATIKTFPFFIGFEENESTAGWIIDNWYSGGTPHSGKLSGRATNDNKEAILMTPPINLPTNFNVYFYWKNADIPSASKVAKHDTTFFEISNDFGQTWEVLRKLSPFEAMENYKREIVNLSTYAGNNVYLRWRYVSDKNHHKAYGVGLDDITIKARPTKPIAELTLNKWEADTVNFNEKKNSDNIFELINIGVGTLKIKEATFSNPRFSTNLNYNEVALNEGDTIQFGFTYNADQAGVHNTKFTIKCNNNESFTINLKGKTYPEQFELWDAENMEDFADPMPWHTINADSLPTWEWEAFDFNREGDSLGFIVFNPTACGVEYDIIPYSGNKFFASIAAKAEGGKPTNNNDWLISPHIKAKANTEFTFWAKTYTDMTGILETFNVAVSTTSYNTEDFKIISGTSEPIEAPYENWKKYSFDLSEYSGKDIYIAIQCVSYHNHIFMVDDLCVYDFDKVNDAPTFISKAPTQITAKRTYIYNIEAEDINFDTLNFSATTLPTWLKLTYNKNGTATLKGYAKTEHIGKHSVEIKVSDSKLTTSQTFEIEVLQFKNSKPQITTTPIKQGKREIIYNYTIKADDKDNDSIIINLSKNSPKWLQIKEQNKNEWLLSGNPKKTGNYNVHIVATDGFDTTKQIFTINIIEPIFKSPNNLIANVDDKNVQLKWNNTNCLKINEGFEQKWIPENWAVKTSKTIDGKLLDVEDNSDTWFQASENSFGNPMPQIIYNGEKSACINYTAKDFQWLISPEINIEKNNFLSFYLFYANKEYESIYRYSNFRVIVITDNKKEEVLFLSDRNNMNLYEKAIKIDLSYYANKHIKIAFVYEKTNTVFPVLIDDIKITRPKTAQDSDGQHIGYKIYKNGILLKTIKDISTINYYDNNLEKGDYNYYVTSIYTNPEGESEPSNIIKTKITSIQEMYKTDDNIIVYPNPSSGVFNIKANDNLNKSAVIEVCKTNGQTIYKGDLKSNNYIDITKFGKGIYLLKIINNNHTSIKKIVCN